ncbi:virion core protein, T7 gp14 family [Caulobacter vibrioides]|uniref:Internal virion protein B n=1 Tax=Caulobacter phage S2B TaxID=2759120 RepID=A0AAE7ML42_9CAUD|nr:hypothetical protein [Caulobacter vibrioides]QOC54136.1 hypothetical protein [Caulobacter phage S2B]QXZ50190.1 hypothetical protein KZH45_09665 [Caulobacter vibrioides]
MCDPVTMAVAAVVSTATSLITEVQSAKAQKRAIADQLTNQEAEINAATTAEMNDRARAARREQARIKVAAGESGVQLGSGSMEALLLDSVTQQQLADERGSMNNDTQLRAARSEANSMYSRVSQPSLLGAGLRLGTAGVQGYASGANLQIARKGISAKAAAGAS